MQKPAEQIFDAMQLTIMGYHLMIALRALGELQQEPENLTDRQKALLQIAQDNLGLFKEWLKEFDAETG